MRKLLFVICSMLVLKAAAQPLYDKGEYKSIFSIAAHNISQPITLDGSLDEACWQTIAPSENFWQHWPADREKAVRKTQVRIAYDQLFVYISAICFDSTATTKPYTIQTLKRDQRFWDSDGFSVVLDPVSQATNGFLFGISPYNVQSEGLLTTNATANFDWDNRWYSATKRYADRWTVEMAIPFKTLRYESGKRSWAINFIRNDIKSNQYQTWTWIPVNLDMADLGYTGSLNFTDSVPDYKKNVSVIPYSIATLKQNNLTDGKVKSTANAGFDAKISLSSSLNLDLTINPDFSQVEVDRQVTNLTRFDVFFPERRTFFLENDDIFSGYLHPELQPFYSRSIGLDHNGNTIPIIGGARLTGNIDNKTRIGLMNIQTAKKDDFAAQNYTAASFQRRFLKRSYVKGYFLNRQGFVTDVQKQADLLSAYGRNSGAEAVYLNDKGSINSWIGYHLSWKPGLQKDNYIKNAGFQYTVRKFSALLDVNLVGTNYYADMGFIQRIENYDAVKDSIIRLGFNQIYSEINYFIFPKKKKITQHILGFENVLVYNPNATLNERLNRLRYFINFQNTSTLRFRMDNVDVRLLYPTLFTNGQPLPPAKYDYNQCNIQYESDNRKKLVYDANIRAGKLYSGDYGEYRVGLTYRVQPWGNFSFNVERNELRFTAPYGSVKLWLLSPRAEINFSNAIFWTTFLQYNTQRNNFNINSRLQWRYKPMSDLFLVYTDNYYSDPFLKNKNRAIVFKANYWLNL